MLHAASRKHMLCPVPVKQDFASPRACHNFTPGCASDRVRGPADALFLPTGEGHTDGVRPEGGHIAGRACVRSCFGVSIMEIPMHKPMNILGLAAVSAALAFTTHHWPQRNSKPSPEWQPRPPNRARSSRQTMDKWGLQTRRRPISSGQPMRRPTTGRSALSGQKMFWTLSDSGQARAGDHCPKPSANRFWVQLERAQGAFAKLTAYRCSASRRTRVGRGRSQPQDAEPAFADPAVRIRAQGRLC